MFVTQNGIWSVADTRSSATTLALAKSASTHLKSTEQHNGRRDQERAEQQNKELIVHIEIAITVQILVLQQFTIKESRKGGERMDWTDPDPKRSSVSYQSKAVTGWR
jgi:hypothetical protein